MEYELIDVASPMFGKDRNGWAQGGDPVREMAVLIWGSSGARQQATASDEGKRGKQSPQTDGSNLILYMIGG